MQTISVCAAALPASRAQSAHAGVSGRNLVAVQPVKAPAARRAVVAKASQRPADFDETLNLVAEKWEQTENKVAVGGALAGAFFAIVVAEWFIHLPLFDVLLGFPIQFVGLLTVANLGIKRYVEKKGDVWSDAEDVVETVKRQLPGFGK